ncbi:PTS sugar transporter subunit IIB [Endozoicomonas ascidiicola]|uniref:PTS sugar transporter subunit IIB n=1 Tax=Endozoicomonas ascidiicola TaxID=1698521 RepID=UPI00083698A8|nr:PTS sugar transporter subunit IIB [Endozoicomonas ascidiicola]
MMKIFLCCSAGMSTSMLVKKMEQTALTRNLDVEIAAFPLEEFSNAIQTYDICLLGPQVKFKLADFKAEAAALNKQVAAIEPMVYGLMNGEKALDQALELLEA